MKHQENGTGTGSGHSNTKSQGKSTKITKCPANIIPRRSTRNTSLAQFQTDLTKPTRDQATQLQERAAEPRGGIKNQLQD